MTAEQEIREAARLTHFLSTGELENRHTDVARNERDDIRIIDGPALVLIPPGRGRSATRGMRP